MYNIGIGNLIHATVTSTIMQISIQRPEMYQLVTLTKKAIIISRPNKMFLFGFFRKKYLIVKPRLEFQIWKRKWAFVIISGAVVYFVLFSDKQKSAVVIIKVTYRH